MSNTSKIESEASQWDLIPLTPKYIEAEHGGYVTALEAALDDDTVRNIALSGSYGVGKSSILRELGRRLDGRVVELSLSTLAPVEAAKLDESVPVQATTPTNRIQQEIVKQLLYREQPNKTPASRFRRIERFRWGRQLGVAVLIGLVVAIVFLLAGWTAQFAATFSTLSRLGNWVHLIVWSSATFLVLMIGWLTYGKLRIKQFSAGAATVTLEDNAVSYFDQYLDEIVYFFEVSDRDVVIFEDIDRFNDSHIFETLRALNTLLNASPQIDKTIRFIYAIKDSIFDRIGLDAEGRVLETEVSAIVDPAQAEAVRANRTKFFDLVMPVVPFITHRSARNLAIELLDEIEHKVSADLLDIAAKFVPDMRLLKNVLNEFIVFRARIFSGDGEDLDLDEADLFAMMLYKSTHLTDFELIRRGSSNLDTLYELSRKLVAENINRLEKERRVLRDQLTQNNGTTNRTAELGERLLEVVRLVVAHQGDSLDTGDFRFEDKTVPVGGVKTLQFWTGFVEADGDPKLLWVKRHYGSRVSFSRSYLEKALRVSLDADSWTTSFRDSLNEEICEKTGMIKSLRGADFRELLTRPQLLVNYEGKERSFGSVAEEILRPGLAYELMRAGYFNRNFTLYTSTFHGTRVSSNAMNFLIHHVQRDRMDVHFELNEKDIGAVVEECGKSALNEPALYNIDILDHLLVNDIKSADIMICSLTSLGQRQVEFLQAYLTAGKNRVELVQRLTAEAPGVLRLLLNELELDEDSLFEFIDAALANLSSVKQHVDMQVTDYLRKHYAQFSVLKSKVQIEQVQHVGTLFEQAGVKVSSLAPLSADARAVFIQRSLYDITHENLAEAIGNTQTVALDAISAADETVFDYVLTDMASYLEAVEGSSATVDTCEHFVEVLEQVLDCAPDSLADVVSRAARNCEVLELKTVSKGMWPALAMHHRFPATFDNVNRYVGALGVDTHLASLLTEAGVIAEVTSADQNTRRALALKILSARKNLPAAATRAVLAESLKLDSYLPVSEIPIEKGELFASLLKHHIIKDSAESYMYLGSTDWATRRAFIGASKDFMTYMTPEIVQQDLEKLLTDDRVARKIKQKIVEESPSYVEVADEQAAQQMARLAIEYKQTIPSDVICKLAEKGVAAQEIVILLVPHLDDLERNTLFAILRMLGDGYSELTELGATHVQIPNTPADTKLLERLTQDGTVSSWKLKSPFITVHRKQK